MIEYLYIVVVCSTQYMFFIMDQMPYVVEYMVYNISNSILHIV